MFIAYCTATLYAIVLQSEQELLFPTSLVLPCLPVNISVHYFVTLSCFCDIASASSFRFVIPNMRVKTDFMRKYNFIKVIKTAQTLKSMNNRNMQSFAF